MADRTRSRGRIEVGRSGQLTGGVESIGARAAHPREASARRSLDGRRRHRRARGGDYHWTLALASISGLARSDQPSFDFNVFRRTLGRQLFAGWTFHRLSERGGRYTAGLGRILPKGIRSRSRPGCSGQASWLVAAERPHHLQSVSRRPLVRRATGRGRATHPGVWRCTEISDDGKRLVFIRGNASGLQTRMAPTLTKSLVFRRPLERGPIAGLSADGKTIAFYQPGTPPSSATSGLFRRRAAKRASSRSISAKPGRQAGRPTDDPSCFPRSAVVVSHYGAFRPQAEHRAADDRGRRDSEPDVSADGSTLLYGTQRKSWS